jgi:hypothetical protein
MNIASLAKQFAEILFLCVSRKNTTVTLSANQGKFCFEEQTFIEERLVSAVNLIKYVISIQSQLKFLTL